jgi:hypothetical protein
VLTKYSLNWFSHSSSHVDEGLVSLKKRKKRPKSDLLKTAARQKFRTFDEVLKAEVTHQTKPNHQTNILIVFTHTHTHTHNQTLSQTLSYWKWFSMWCRTTKHIRLIFPRISLLLPHLHVNLHVIFVMFVGTYTSTLLSLSLFFDFSFNQTSCLVLKQITHANVAGWGFVLWNATKHIKKVVV